MVDLNQLYTILFCVWFLLLGAIEFFVLRFVWRRWFFTGVVSVMQAQSGETATG